VAVVLAAPVFTASGIKADNDFTGSYLIQLSAPVLSDTTLYTFTVNPLNSAQLNTFLQTYRNTWCALEIYDSVNGILTTPLELQIMPGYSLSGTPTDNVAGVIVVAAGKTVTFPQSLTFPSALGTNGFQLTTDGAGALTWATGTNAPGGSTTQVQYNNAGSFAGITGATTNGTALTLVAPVLGAATATSLNGAAFNTGTSTGSKYISFGGGSAYINLEGSNVGYGYIDTQGGFGGYISTGGSSSHNGGGGNIITAGNGTARGGSIDTTPNGATAGGSINTSYGGSISTNNGGGSINTNSSGGYINTSSSGGSINTSSGGGSIDTGGTGSIGFGNAGTRTTFGGVATTARFINLPDASGTILLEDNTATLTNKSIAATQLTGNVAVARIATALTTPGAIGGTTASTGAFTTLTGTSTLTLGVAGPTGTAGTVVLKNATNAYTTTIVPSVVTGSRQLNLPLITGTDTVAVLGLTQTFTGNKTFSGTVSCGSTLAVTEGTTLTGGLTVGGTSFSPLITTNYTPFNFAGSGVGTLTNAPDSGNPTKWILISDNGVSRYIPTWETPP